MKNRRLENMTEEANKVLFDFDEKLGELICEHLVGRVSSQEVDDFYNWTGSQIREKLEEQESLVNLLKKNQEVSNGSKGRCRNRGDSGPT